MKEETLDKIDRYLRNEMSEVECTAFEKILAGDDALRRQVTLSRDIIKAIERKQMKEHLKSVDKSLHRRKKMIWWSGITSVLAACLLFAVFFISINQNDASIELLDGSPSSIGVRGDTYNQDVVKLLEHKQYDKAINLIDSLETEYIKESEAIRQNDILTEEQTYDLACDSVALYQLGWLRIQALIGHRKIVEAKILLEQYKKQEGDYQGKADSLWSLIK